MKTISLKRIDACRPCRPPSRRTSRLTSTPVHLNAARTGSNLGSSGEHFPSRIITSRTATHHRSTPISFRFGYAVRPMRNARASVSPPLPPLTHTHAPRTLRKLLVLAATDTSFARRPPAAGNYHGAASAVYRQRGGPNVMHAKDSCSPSLDADDSRSRYQYIYKGDRQNASHSACK